MWHRIGNKGVGLMVTFAKHVVVVLAFALPMMPIAMADDTKRCIKNLIQLSESDLQKIDGGNTRGLFTRLDQKLSAKGL